MRCYETESLNLSSISVTMIGCYRVLPQSVGKSASLRYSFGYWALSSLLVMAVARQLAVDFTIADTFARQGSASSLRKSITRQIVA